MTKKLFKIIILLLLPLTLSLSSNAYAGNVNDLKDKFTKIFFESSLEYMEAQAYLFEALEMNDEASKTRKSIDFVKNNKKKEGKRLTNAFNTVSENSNAIEGALTKEAATSAEAKVLYAKALPHTVKGVIGTIQLPPEAKALLDALKADKMAALKMGSFMKVLPKIPGYVKSATTVGKLIVSGAKSRDVEGADDATSAMGDL
jgi:nucleoside diphosphate kinase